MRSCSRSPPASSQTPLWFYLSAAVTARAYWRSSARSRLSPPPASTRRRTYISKRGGVTLLIAKFVPGLGNVAAPIAGQSGMSYCRFFLWDLAGSVLWVETFLLAGRFFGDFAKRYSPPFFHLLGRFAVVVVILMVGVLLIWRIVKQRRFLAQVRALRLTPEELKAMLDQATATGGQPPYIVDLRHPLDYLPDPRVLPGARRIGPGAAELAAHAERIPRDRDIIALLHLPQRRDQCQGSNGSAQAWHHPRPSPARRLRRLEGSGLPPPRPR